MTDDNNTPFPCCQLFVIEAGWSLHQQAVRKGRWHFVRRTPPFCLQIIHIFGLWEEAVYVEKHLKGPRPSASKDPERKTAPNLNTNKPNLWVCVYLSWFHLISKIWVQAREAPRHGFSVMTRHWHSEQGPWLYVLLWVRQNKAWAARGTWPSSHHQHRSWLSTWRVLNGSALCRLCLGLSLSCRWEIWPEGLRQSYSILFFFFFFQPGGFETLAPDTQEPVTFHGFVMDTSHSFLLPCLAPGLSDL